MKSKFDLAYFKKDIVENPIKYIMMTISISGAFLTASPFNFYRGFGFAIWLISNGYVIYLFYKQDNIPMSAAYLFYQFANLYGIYNNWM